MPSAPSPFPSRIVAWLASAYGLTFLVIATFVVIGGYDRLHDLGSGSLWNDEAQSTLYAFSVLSRGYPVINSPHLINNWEPLYPYLEAASIRALGYSNFAYRLPAALIGIALIPLSYIVGARLRDRYVGITLAAMVAFSSEYIAWSRQARWYVLLVMLMALGLLAALSWSRGHSQRTRNLSLACMVTCAILAALASIGLFLLYIPAILVAALTYLLAIRWESVRRFFGRPSAPVLPSGLPPARLIPYRYRLPVLIVGTLVVLVAVLVELAALTDFSTNLITRVFGFAPYPVVWSGNFGTYLVEYYPGVVVMVVLSAVFVWLRRDPVELALLAFVGGSFVSVSVGASVTNDIAGGTLSFERHIEPLLYFLFLLSSVSIVELIRRTYRVLFARAGAVRRLRKAAPGLIGVVVVMILVVPGVVVPSGVTVYPKVTYSSADSLVPWVAFSLDPNYPSALYAAGQANYQLAADYVLAHRNATDVVASTNPGPPTVYLGDGSVEYWVRANALPSTIIQVNGAPANFLTSSLLVSNASQLESLLLQRPGWLISDVPNGRGGPLGNGMSHVLQYFMTNVSAGSDVSISLYHWNQSTQKDFLEMFLAGRPDLQKMFGKDFVLAFTNLTNWAATIGVTTSVDRDMFLPMEPYLVSKTDNTTRPLAVLFEVYNNRPDLQLAFPQILNASHPSDKALIDWAKDLVSHSITDPAYSTLQPYTSWYLKHG